MPSPRALSALVVVLLLVAVGPALPYRPPFSANESNAIGDVRTFLSAQVAYASTNEGFFTSDPRCLSTPTLCLPGYSSTAPTFLDASILTPGPRRGYLRSVHAGPVPAPADLKGRKIAPFSVVRIAITAIPERPASTYPTGGLRACFGPQATGVRGICGDDTGIICVTEDGSLPPVKDGRCEPCPRLLQ